MVRPIYAAGGAVGLIILYLLMHRVSVQMKAGKDTTIPGLATTQYLDGKISFAVEPTIPHGSLFDWLNGAGACSCDGPPRNALVINSYQVAPRTNPGYVYIAPPVLSMPPAPHFDVDPTLYGIMPEPVVYEAPPLPSWWWEWGYNVHHELARYAYTSDGTVALMGKYNRSTWNDPPGRKSYPKQTKQVTLVGDDLYAANKHYKHDATRDTPKPPPLPQDYAVAFSS